MKYRVQFYTIDDTHAEWISSEYELSFDEYYDLQHWLDIKMLSNAVKSTVSSSKD